MSEIDTHSFFGRNNSNKYGGLKFFGLKYQLSDRRMVAARASLQEGARVVFSGEFKGFYQDTHLSETL